MKYYEINELRNRVYKLKEDIRNGVTQELYQKHGEDMSLSGFDIVVRFCYQDEILDIHDKNITGLTLESDVPDVYQLESTHPLVQKGAPTIHIVFTVNKYVKRSEDVLGIGENTYTFNTYEEFLVFIDEKTRHYNITSDKPFFVSLRDRKSNISISNFFNHPKITRQGTGNTPGFFIGMLTSYKKLIDENKAVIDKLLCPITISKKDVEERFDLDFVTVYVDKEDLIKLVFQTDKWDSVIKETFTVSAKDINQVRQK